MNNMKIGRPKTDLMTRFMKFVSKGNPSECWLWTAVEMRKGGKKLRELSAEFGVNITTIFKAVTGKNWRHLKKKFMRDLMETTEQTQGENGNQAVSCPDCKDTGHVTTDQPMRWSESEIPFDVALRVVRKHFEAVINTRLSHGLAEICLTVEKQFFGTPKATFRVYDGAFSFAPTLEEAIASLPTPDKVRAKKIEEARKKIEEAEREIAELEATK